MLWLNIDPNYCFIGIQDYLNSCFCPTIFRKIIYPSLGIKKTNIPRERIKLIYYVILHSKKGIKTFFKCKSIIHSYIRNLKVLHWNCILNKGNMNRYSPPTNVFCRNLILTLMMNFNLTEWGKFQCWVDEETCV